MKTGTLYIGAAVLVLAAGCNRNDRSSGSVLDRNNGQQASITVNGCLQAGEQGLGSREPNAASRSAEGVNRFILTNTTSATTSTGPLYLLEGRANELRTHVGQQVEVTGRPDDNRAPSADPNQPNAQLLRVESVRMINMRCDITR
jgi:hypothetical protein